MNLSLAQRAEAIRQTRFEAVLSKHNCKHIFSFGGQQQEENTTACDVEMEPSSSVQNQKWRTEELGTKEKALDKQIYKQDTQAQIPTLAKCVDGERASTNANMPTETQGAWSERLKTSTQPGSLAYGDPYAHWTEYTELTSWYLALSPDQLPIPPFPLSECAVVTGEKFFSNLKNEIELGKKSHRAQRGLLQDHLKLLRKVVSTKTGVNVRQDDILDIRKP